MQLYIQLLFIKILTFEKMTPIILLLNQSSQLKPNVHICIIFPQLLIFFENIY